MWATRGFGREAVKSEPGGGKAASVWEGRFDGVSSPEDLARAIACFMGRGRGVIVCRGRRSEKKEGTYGPTRRVRLRFCSPRVVLRRWHF